MVDKATFNNWVMGHKILLKRARTQTINQVVHKLRKLEKMDFSKADEKEQPTKTFSKKINKWCMTLKYLKILKLLDVMKKVLLLERSPKSIISNNFSGPEELAIAMLAMNKITESVLKKFFNEFGLNNTKNIDEKWKNDLLKKSKRQLRLQRISEKKLRRKKYKMQKEYEKKRHDWLKENLSNEEKIGLQTEIEESSTVCFQTKQVKTEIKDCEVANNFHNLQQSKNLLEKTQSKTETSNGLFVEKRFVELESEKKTDKILTKDPFFLTETGENYLSTATGNTIIMQDLENSDTDTQLNMILKNSKTSMKNSVNSESPSKSINSLQLKKKPIFRKNGNKILTFESRMTESFEENRCIHPSWLSKQKIRPVIKDFKGTKITFDDNHKKKNNITSVANDTDNKAMSKKEFTVQDKHPSWVAKQKMRPTIQSFQGTKILFDTNDVD